MQIIVSQGSGFCSGVQRAADIALREAKERNPVYTLGELIHNAGFVEELKGKGVIPLEDEGAAPQGATVIVRSHGAARQVIEGLTARGVRVVDATCPSVAAIHKKVAKYSAEGYAVCVVGNKDHPEVIGTLGWCEGVCAVTDGKGELPEELLSCDKLLVVVQTTYSEDIFNDFCKKIEAYKKNNQKSVEIFNTICYTTKGRQKGVVALAPKVDAFFVIGDKQSSNTAELFKIAKALCPKTYLISNVSDVKSVADIKNITKLGIVAGASAPQKLVMEVINSMDQENKVDNVIVDEVADVAAEAAQANEAPVAEVAAEPQAKEEVKAEPKKEETMTMADAIKRFTPKSYREGMKVKASIISVDPTGLSVSVDFGKNDSGFIDKEEVELDGSFNPDNYTVGQMVDAVIIPKTDSKQKAINLSKKAYDVIKLEDEAVKKILEGEEFSLACTQAIKGGLIGHIGTYTIFVPASQIRIGYVKNLEDYVGKKLRLRILPPKEVEAAAEVAESDEAAEAPAVEEKKRRPNPKRIVAGQRIILEEEKAAREEAFWEVMQVNNIIKGKVKRFTPFGAFVSIMGFDCLAHISDLSWTKIKDPSEVLEINKSYDFVVIKVDRENGKVSLGYKQLQKKPYELAAEKYHVGDTIKGKVERIKDFGAFIELEPGIDGLVHVSEIGYKWIANANEALKIGDEIEAKIIGFENNKITLSIKALLTPPVATEDAETEVSEDNGEEKPSRAAKFAKRAQAADGAVKTDRKERKPRRDKEESDEPREWVSAPNGGATFADLFKGIDINKFEDENK